MKKIKKWLSNKNFILIVCTVIIVGLSIALIYSINSNKSSSHEPKITTKHIKNDKEKSQESNKNKSQETDENESQEIDKNAENNNNQSTSSSLRKKNNNTTSSPDSKNKNNNTDDVVYLCPSGYTQSKDQKTCTKIVETEEGYICPNGYEQSSDKKTCTKELLADYIQTEHCDCDNVPMDGYHAWDSYYDKKTGICYCIAGTSSDDYVKEKCNGGITKNWSEEFGFCYMGTTTKRKILKDCPNGYSWKNETQCYKIDNKSSNYTTYCPSGYTMNNDKMSCSKTVSATIK